MNEAQRNRQKKAVADAALHYIEPGIILGLGSGSTVHCFIDALAAVRSRVEAVLVSSDETAERVAFLKLPIWDLNNVGEIPLYVDGADEVDASCRLLKGGGGALTREKILATAAKKFVCIVDASKQVDLLGQFPVAVEVIPMARSAVARKIVLLGGQPVWREGTVTDNGNMILDVFNFRISDPLRLEEQLNNIPGVVANGIFAARPADIVLVATENGIQKISRSIQ